MPSDYRLSITQALAEAPSRIYRPSSSATLIRIVLRTLDTLGRPFAAVDVLAYVRVIDVPTNAAQTANSWLKDLAGSNLTASTSALALSADGFVQVAEESTGVYAACLSLASGSTLVSGAIQWRFVTTGPSGTLRRVDSPFTVGDVLASASSVATSDGKLDTLLTRLGTAASGTVASTLDTAAASALLASQAAAPIFATLDGGVHSTTSVVASTLNAALVITGRTVLVVRPGTKLFGVGVVTGYTGASGTIAIAVPLAGGLTPANGDIVIITASPLT